VGLQVSAHVDSFSAVGEKSIGSQVYAVLLQAYFCSHASSQAELVMVPVALGSHVSEVELQAYITVPSQSSLQKVLLSVPVILFSHLRVALLQKYISWALLQSMHPAAQVPFTYGEQTALAQWHSPSPVAHAVVHEAVCDAARATTQRKIVWRIIIKIVAVFGK
jgi:hypothetical protein